MADVVERFDVDVVVPTVDEELSALPALRAALPEETPVVAPRQPVVDVALDKYRTYRCLRAADVPVPETWLADEADAIDASAYPLIAKPRRGRGSRGVERVGTVDELESYLDEREATPEECLVQRFVDGQEFTSSVVATESDRLLSVVPKEAEAKEGSTTVGVTRRAPAVESSCRRVFEALSPGGPLNVQQILAPDGTPYVIEINPRFSSTSCLTAAAGVDEFDLLVRDALGEAVEPVDSYTPGTYILRYDGHVFADAEELDRFRQ